MKTLVLNAGYEPLSIVSFKRALVLVLNGKATILAGDGGTIHSQHVTLQRPSVILLSRYVKPPRNRVVTLSRRGVLRRDHFRCAYCAATANTVDHVLPRSRGGTNTWENLVACCRGCNNLKGNRTPAEIGWSLRTVPGPPRRQTWVLRGVEQGVPEWHEYLESAHVAA